MDRYRALLGILRDQSKRHEAIAPADIYKLLYQVNLGPAHGLKDPEAAKSSLWEEWQDPGKRRPGEALLEQIDPEPPLQLRHALAQRGRRHAERGRSLGPGVVVHDRDDGRYVMYYWDRRFALAERLRRAEPPNETDFDFAGATPIRIEGEEAPRVGVAAVGDHELPPQLVGDVLECDTYEGVCWAIKVTNSSGRFHCLANMAAASA